MNAIYGIRRQARELVDGTLEIKIHVEPRYKADFHKLFPEIDLPVALAPLIPGVEASAGKEVGGSTWAQLGPLCQSAIKLCEDGLFQEWVAEKCQVGNTPQGNAYPDEELAARYIRERCAVFSRKQIDERPDAKELFQLMMAEYRGWLNAAA